MKAPEKYAILRHLVPNLPKSGEARKAERKATPKTEPYCEGLAPVGNITLQVVIVSHDISLQL